MIVWLPVLLIFALWVKSPFSSLPWSSIPPSDHEHQSSWSWSWSPAPSPAMNEPRCLLGCPCSSLLLSSSSFTLTTYHSMRQWWGMITIFIQFGFSFCDVSSSSRVQMGPKWPQIIKICVILIILDHFDPRRPLWQGGIKCGKRRRGFLDSEDPEHTLFCRDLRAFSGVIFPYFDGSSNIFATAQSLEHIDNIVYW